MVVVVFGLPGSGKSYFAARLAAEIRADYINSDLLRRQMIQERTYSDSEKALIYDAMFMKMDESISQGKDIVLDATFHKHETRDFLIQTVAERCRIFFIEVVAKEDLIRQRLKTKRVDSEADFGVYEIIKEQWELFTKSHLVLESTDRNINEMLQKAVQYLKA